MRGGWVTLSPIIIKNISRWNILLFIMISGYLFLPRDISIAIMWKKYIRRIAICFAVWSLLYTAYNAVINIHQQMPLVMVCKNIVGDFFNGGTRRMWYLVMLLALYAFIPLISRWVRHSTKQEHLYALILTGLLAILLPSLQMIHPFETVFGLDIERIQGVYSSVYVFYLLFGYLFLDYLSKDEMTRGQAALYIAGGLVSAIIMAVIAKYQGEVSPIGLVFYMPVTACLVVIAQRSDGFLYSHKCGAILRNISDCSFGIYLIHTAVQYAFLHLGAEHYFLRMPPVTGILCYFAALFCVSWVLAIILRKSKVGRSIT